MNAYSDINKIKIVFFSGTGSTEKVASVFEEKIKQQGKNVIIYEINSRNIVMNENEDMLIILYPAHAFNAPEAVYEYIENIYKVEKIPAVVISVSGGGEVTPNTSCRLHCIKRLEKKGFNVIYEKMIVMPSNFIIPTNDILAIRLLEVLPHKIEKIINDLSNGVIRRTKPNLVNKLLSNIGELEKHGARYCGERINANENCNGCGWCEKHCPRANITIINSKPKFSNKCSLCLKCIYGCPQRALIPGIGKFIVLKKGYDLNAIKKQTDTIKIDSIEELTKGYLNKGIKEYLLNNE